MRAGGGFASAVAEAVSSRERGAFGDCGVLEHAQRRERLRDRPRVGELPPSMRSTITAVSPSGTTS